MHHTCKVLNVPDVSTSILKRLLFYIVASFDTPEKKFLGENILDFFCTILLMNAGCYMGTFGFILLVLF